MRRPLRRLVILARWPAPGRCKRRLAAGLDARRAAAIQTRLTDHGAAAARQACGASIELLLACSGLGESAAERWGRRLRVDRTVDQGAGSLGLRLRRQVVLAHREGIRQLVLIGSDLPELEAGDLLAAFAALDAGASLVLGPALDGGYWLIGLGWCGRGRGRRPCQVPPAARLFAGGSGAIRWGGSQVRAQTLQAAAGEGLAATLLAPRADLDRGADLARWR